MDFGPPPACHECGGRLVAERPATQGHIDVVCEQGHEARLYAVTTGDGFSILVDPVPSA